jgi:4-oxalmesaconate hydratase
MIIDCHGHYTTAPPAHEAWRRAQVAAASPAEVPPPPRISDDEIRESLLAGQIALQKARGIDLVLFSPRAAGMGHHEGDARANAAWADLCNTLIHRVCTLFPERFIGVCQLPQAPGVSPATCIPELERAVRAYGFVACNLNPDPSGGRWSDPPLHDRYWYPLYEKMVELDVPAMVHVSSSCNPHFHTTGAHYINADTAAFMQFLTSDLFRDFPTLKFIIPHGGGAAPYHWGRYRGLAQDMGRPPLAELLLRNVFFDTCVYHQAGMELLFRVVPVENILFASEMLGAVRGIDPETGHPFDDTRRMIEAIPWLGARERALVYAGNALRVYGRLAGQMRRQGITVPEDAASDGAS